MLNSLWMFLSSSIELMYLGSLFTTMLNIVYLCVLKAFYRIRFFLGAQIFWGIGSRCLSPFSCCSSSICLLFWRKRESGFSANHNKAKLAKVRFPIFEVTCLLYLEDLQLLITFHQLFHFLTSSFSVFFEWKVWVFFW